jgi:hypothetical protein
MSYSKRVKVGRRRSILGMGDGPITSPNQVDVPVFDPDEEILVGEVNPRRVACEDLPADSPWRRTGGVCPPAGPSLMDRIMGWLTPSPASPADVPVATPTAPVSSSILPRLALLAAAGGGAYYLYKRSR